MYKNKSYFLIFVNVFYVFAFTSLNLGNTMRKF